MFEVDYDNREIFIYDDIGPAWLGMIDAASVVSALSDMRGQRVSVRLNTPGGSVDEGIAIYNALVRHKGGIDTYVDSLAASMGSYLLQAGQSRTVTANAMVMVHDPWTIVLGNSAELRKEADILDKYRDRMIPDFSSRTGKSDQEIESLMAAETWMAGQEIVEMGFADRVDGVSTEPATVAEGRFRNTPESILRKPAAGSRTKCYPRRMRAAANAKPPTNICQ